MSKLAGHRVGVLRDPLCRPRRRLRIGHDSSLQTTHALVTGLSVVNGCRSHRYPPGAPQQPLWDLNHPANLVRYLKHEGHWPAVLRSLDDLASRLETHPPPINYQRRRWTAARYDDVIASVNHTVAYLGPPYPWCHTHLLVELFWLAYTGGDLRLAAPATGTLLNPDLYHQHDGNADPLTDPRLLAFFTAAAATLNQATHASAEPLTWQPP